MPTEEVISHVRRSATLLERAPNPTTEYGELLQWFDGGRRSYHPRRARMRGRKSTLAAGTLPHGPVPGI